MTSSGSGRVNRLRRFGRSLTGASAAALVDNLAGHLDVAIEGVELAILAIGGEDGPAEGSAPIAALMEAAEHRGDSMRRSLVSSLAECLTPPLDREDLFRLSRAIDDVLDNTRDFFREWRLYRPEHERRLASLLEAASGGLEELRHAVVAIQADPDAASPHLLAAKQQAHQVRRRYESEVASLLAGGEVTVEVLKHRELLRRLDVVGIRLDEAVDILFDALVKRGAGLGPAPSR
jgi:hypothetical protein